MEGFSIIKHTRINKIIVEEAKMDQRAKAENSELLQLTILITFIVLTVIFIFSNISRAQVTDDRDYGSDKNVPGILNANYFYAVSPHGQSTGLWSIDPATGATNLVTRLLLQNGQTPNFMTNSLAFNPKNELYAWDTGRSQLYSIDYSSGMINYIGSPGTYSTPRWINGLSFDRAGNLYGLHGPTDELLSINPVTGAVSSIGYLGRQINHNGLAIDFRTDKLYALTGCMSGWGCQSDMLYELDKTTGQAIASYDLPFLDLADVGVEFHPVNGKLYAIRDKSMLMEIDMLNGTETEKFLLEGIGSTNLAAPYPAAAPVPEPGTFALLASGLAGVGYLRRRLL